MTQSDMTNSNSDKRWGWFNESLQKYMKANDFWGLGSTYYEMANFLEKESKDASHLRKLGYDMKLKVNAENLHNLERSDVISGVEIISCSNSCELCKGLNGKCFSIDVAKKSKPLPVRECRSEGGCRCMYGPIVE